MQVFRFMTFLLAGSALAPHSPGSGRAFSWSVLVVLAAALAAGCAPMPIGTAPLAYVPNEGLGTISIIDTAGDAVIGEIATGGKPRGLALSRDGRFIYVSDGPSSSLKVVD